MAQIWIGSYGGGGGGITLPSLVGNGLKYLRVTSDESGIEWANTPSGGQIEWDDVTDKPTFGTAALEDTGTGAGQIPLWIATGSGVGLGAFNGSQITDLSKSQVGLGNVDNTSDANKPISTATQTALNAKAPINNPTFTGTVNGVSKAMVGLGNVDNTSDANKPVSTAQQLAIDAKANKAGDTFTGKVNLPASIATAAYFNLGSGANVTSNLVNGDVWLSGTTLSYRLGGTTYVVSVVGHTHTKSEVGLGNVDNTSDANKPVSTAQQSALDLKLNISNKAAASDFRTGTDDAKYLTVKAIRDAFAFVALTDASTIAIDMATGFNFSVTLGGNRTLGAPTNSIAGQAGLILIKQDGTGNRTLAFNSAWDFGSAGVPTATTTAGKTDAIAYTVTTGGGSPIIRATYIKGFA